MDATQELEIRILSVIRRKKSYYKYKPVLQSTFFGSEATKQLFLIIEYFFTKYDAKKLTIGNFRLLALRKIRDKNIKEDVVKILRSVRKKDGRDSEVMEESIKDFAKRQLVKQVLNDGIQLLENPNLDLTQLREVIDQATNLSIENPEEFYDYFKEPDVRMTEEATEKKVPTCIPKLDEALDGGLSPGELCVFLGPPGRGKTLALINMGVAGLIQGLTVLHITLEIHGRKVARRYDERISGRTYKRLQQHPHRLKSPLKDLHKKGCDLIIKDLSMDEPTVDELKSSIIAYQNRTKKKFDLIIIDYGDLLRSSRKYKESHHEYEAVYKAMRRMARYFGIPVYTASQTNRKSLSKLIITMEDVADSFGKVKVADVVIAICQTPEEEADRLARLFIAKSRKKSGHPIIKIECDPDRAYMGAYQHGKQIKRIITG